MPRAANHARLLANNANARLLSFALHERPSWPCKPIPVDVCPVLSCTVLARNNSWPPRLMLAAACQHHPMSYTSLCRSHAQAPDTQIFFIDQCIDDYHKRPVAWPAIIASTAVNNYFWSNHSPKPRFATLIGPPAAPPPSRDGTHKQVHPSHNQDNQPSQCRQWPNAHLLTLLTTLSCRFRPLSVYADESRRRGADPLDPLPLGRTRRCPL